jgi:DnaJ family protein B protein 12
MESNKDEALRSFAIAEKYFNAENLTAARKFCTKSISLFNTPQAEKLLVKINAAAANPPSSTSSATSADSAGPSTSASGAEGHPSAAGMKHRHNPPNVAASASTSSSSSATTNGNAKKRDYTPEQHAVVKRVRACKMTEYYEILEVKKDCEEADIKKAYRKVCVTVTMLAVYCWLADKFPLGYSDISCSWRLRCILTRMERLERMKHLKVGVFDVRGLSRTVLLISFFRLNPQ